MTTTKSKIASFQIDNHGPEHAQFFQGAGLAFSKFDHIATGNGASEKEAYEDALNQIAQTHDVDLTELEAYGKAKHNDETVSEAVQNDDSGEWNHYLSIRYSLRND